MEPVMIKPLATVAVVLIMASNASGHATSYRSADVTSQPQLAESVTQPAVATTGARATAAQDARNVGISRQISDPTPNERRADVIGTAVYPQSGPAMAALAKRNATVSREIPVPSMAERRVDVIGTAVYPQSGPSMAALEAKNAEAQKRMVN
jgi:hypothetical protein